ncbi:MAG: hypothetical protein C5B50_02125 [Verrucomicrobia bacterium]|nr:MAG: hypothetical protein C5B50_02125 [Verrucomicrobiota bacterium]
MPDVAVYPQYIAIQAQFPGNIVRGSQSKGSCPGREIKTIRLRQSALEKGLLYLPLKMPKLSGYPEAVIYGLV